MNKIITYIAVMALIIVISTFIYKEVEPKITALLLNETKEAGSEPEILIPKLKSIPDSLFTNDYEFGVKIALENNKKIFLLFHADWCGPCKKLEEMMKKDAIKEKLKDFVVISLDVDQEKNKELLVGYKVKYLPTYFILEKGKNIKSNSGCPTKNEFINFLN